MKEMEEGAVQLLGGRAFQAEEQPVQRPCARSVLRRKQQGGVVSWWAEPREGVERSLRAVGCAIRWAEPRCWIARVA